MKDERNDGHPSESADGEYVEVPSEAGDASVTFDEVLEKYFDLSLDKPIVVGKFETSGWTQQGGQSTVFKAFDPDLQRFVAIKLYHAALSEKQRQRVLDEGRALASIDSPWVARCHSVDTIVDAPFLVLEWVEGQTLDKYLRDQHVDWNELRELFSKIASGVDALHEQKLIHRDLKPSNILVTESGEPKIVDLGLVRHLEHGSSDAAGTFSFMAPEVAREQTERIGVPTDIFGLGAVLYFMLTGQALYESDSKSGTRRRATEHDIIDPRELQSGIPADLHEVCLTCLSEEPDSRFHDVDELLQGIRQEHRNWQIEVIGIAALVFAVLCSGMLWLGNKHQPATPEIAANPKSKSQETVAVAPVVDDPAPQAYVTKPHDTQPDVDTTEVSPWNRSVSLASDGKFDQAAAVADSALEQKLQDQADDKETRRLIELAVNLALQRGDVESAVNLQQQRVALERMGAEQSGYDARVAESNIVLRHLEQLRELDDTLTDKVQSGIASLLRSYYLYLVRKDVKTSDIAATAALKDFREAVGEQHVLVVESLEQLTLLAFASEDSQKIKDHMDQLAISVLAVFGENSTQYCDLLHRQIMVLRYRNDPEQALSVANRAIEIASKLLGPQDPVVFGLRLMQGQVLAQLEQYGSAYRSLSQALDQFPVNMERNEDVGIALIGLAAVCLKTQKPEECRVRLEQAREILNTLRAGKPSVSLSLARALAVESQLELALGNLDRSDELFAEAMNLLPEVTRGTPSHAEFFRIYCAALVNRAKLDETTPEQAQFLFQRAESRLNEAIVILETRADRDSPMFLTRMAQLQRIIGDCEFGQRDYEKALVEYAQGIEYWSRLDPPNMFSMADLHFRCAWSYEMMEQFGDARDDLLVAIAHVDEALESGVTPQGEAEFKRARKFLVGQLQLMEWHIIRPILVAVWPVIARPLQQIPFLRILVPNIHDQFFCVSSYRALNQLNSRVVALVPPDVACVVYLRISSEYFIFLPCSRPDRYWVYGNAPKGKHD